MLEHDGVAGHQRGNDGVDRGEIRVVPRRHDEHDAERFVPDEAREAFLLPDIDVGERGIGGRDHMARAFLDTGDLAGRMRDGTAHLPAELAGDLGLFRNEGIDRAAEQGGALTQRRPFPCCLRAHGRGERAGRSRPPPASGLST